MSAGGVMSVGEVGGRRDRPAAWGRRGKRRRRRRRRRGNDACLSL